MPFLSLSLFEELAIEESRREHAAIVFKSNLLRTVFPILCGSTNILHGENVLFDGLHQMVEDIPYPQPTFYDGVPPAEIDERVKEDLQHLIIPSAANPQAPAVPNFFVEIRAPSEDEKWIRCRACYNGALGARAIHSVQNYGRDEPIYDGNAHVITTIYDPRTGVLQIFLSYVIRSSKTGQLAEYYMTELGSWNLTDDKESFVRGTTVFRNARDFAKERRDRFIKEANAKARELEAGLQ